MTIDEYREALARIPRGAWGPLDGLHQQIYRISVGAAPGRRAPARGPVAGGISEDALRFRFALHDRRFPSAPAMPSRQPAAHAVCASCSTGVLVLTPRVECPGCGALVNRRGQVVA